MKLKKQDTVLLVSLMFISVTGITYANEVEITTNKPVDITYQVAHKNQDGQPILSEKHSMHLDMNAKLPVELESYTLAGVVLTAVNGHETGATFTKAEECSMVTDKTNTTGKITITVSEHKLACSVSGGHNR